MVRIASSLPLFLSLMCFSSSSRVFERITLSLAADFLRYISEELDSLAHHIQTTDGELANPMTQVYEEHILKTLIKSVIWCTLITGIFLQVQNAKICLPLFFFFRSQELGDFTQGVKPLIISSFFPYLTV